VTLTLSCFLLPIHEADLSTLAPTVLSTRSVRPENAPKYYGDVLHICVSSWEIPNT